MKKNFDLAELIKEAVKEGVLEAFAEMNGVSVAGEAEGEGDKKDPIRPEPNVGAGGFSLR